MVGSLDLVLPPIIEIRLLRWIAIKKKEWWASQEALLWKYSKLIILIRSQG